VSETTSRTEPDLVRVPETRTEAGADEKRPFLRRIPDRLRRLGPRGQGAAAFGLYALASIALYAIPILGRFGSAYVGVGKTDSKLYMWSLEWMPYALAHGLNPLFTHVVWAPGGTGLAWVTTIPGPSLVMIPFTKLFGPLFAYNLLLVAAPALASWGAYLVCKRVTNAFWPSVAGGYLFGFSTYIVSQMHGHVNLVLIFPVPLCVYLVLRRIDGTMRAAAFVALLALALVFLFSTSTELFATATLFGAIAFVGALAFAPRDSRGRLFGTGMLVASSYALAAIVLSPYLYLALAHRPVGSIRPIELASSDLLSFVVPRWSTWVGGEAMRGISEHFTSSVVEDAAYLSVALVLMLILFASSARRVRTTWLLLGFVFVVALLSLGPTLHIEGRPSLRLPGAILADTPLIEHATPQRFPAYLWLAVGVIAALWLAAGRSRLAWARYALVGVGMVMILPDVSAPPYHPDLAVPRFFADGSYARHIRPGEIVYAIPAKAGEEMLWQAQTDMYFRLAQGYVGPIPSEYQGNTASRGLAFLHPNLKIPDPVDFAWFLERHRVRLVIMQQPAPMPFQQLMTALGTKPTVIEDVSLYPIPADVSRSALLAGTELTGDLHPGGVLDSFSFPGVGGGTLTYDAIRGKPLVLSLYASWCEACGRQLADLERARNALPGVGFLGVAESDPPAAALAALRRAGASFPAISDAKGRFFLELSGTSMPLTVFVDADGRIANVHQGALSAGEIERLAARYFRVAGSG
jgi:peroxiredoxin